MELRNVTRFNLPDPDGAEFLIEDVRFEIDKIEHIRGKAMDINLHGMGMIIEDITREKAGHIEGLSTFYMKIFLGNEVMMIGVKKMWHKLIVENGKHVYKGGVKFEIISSDDRLKLSRFLENIRR
jgi:hypothetical protein